MTSRTTTTRTIRLAIATAAALVLMSQAAQARPIVPIGGGAQAAPSSTAYPGTYRPATIVAPLPPDRADLIGTSRAQLGQSTQLTSVGNTTAVRTTASGFDWFAATMGAGATLVVVLIAGAGIAARGRRHVPLSA
jgi:hypothetical protein